MGPICFLAAFARFTSARATMSVASRLSTVSSGIGKSSGTSEASEFGSGARVASAHETHRLQVWLLLLLEVLVGVVEGGCVVGGCVVGGCVVGSCIVGGLVVGGSAESFAAAAAAAAAASFHISLQDRVIILTNHGRDD
jgi:hypothetical protein